MRGPAPAFSNTRYFVKMTGISISLTPCHPGFLTTGRSFDCLPVETMSSTTRQTYRTRITLLQRIQRQHDENAWREFFSIYRNFVYSVIVRMNVSQEDAADLTQEVFLKLWKRLEELDLNTVGRFRSYLTGIARYCVIDHFRREKGRHGQKDKAREEYLFAEEKVSTSHVEAIVEEEWESFLSAKALENVSKRFSKEAISVFTDSLAGMEIKDIAEKHGLGLSTAYRLRGRVVESLVKEVRALEAYLA